MKFVKQGLAALLGVSIAGISSVTVAQDQDFSQVEIETIPVAENIYMLVGEGGNIGVSAGEDGVLLIDDQYAPLTEKIKAAVGEISDLPIQFLINTHWHFDHTGGNENLGNAGVVIVAHDEVYTRMSTDQFIEAFQREFPPSPDAALPKITFNDTATFHINGQTIQGFHVAEAHTDGDTIIHIPEANVIHAGDTYFNGIYPFIDASSGGSIAGMISAAEKTLSLADSETKIIPGHGALSNRIELEAYRAMLVDVKLTTEKAIAEGLSLEEFIASEPTAEYDADWGNGFLKPEDFLTIVYQSLASQI
ncbi:MAG: MBL fold metallo-hydrolase [Cyanobacteria bacterium J06648_1]